MPEVLSAISPKEIDKLNCDLKQELLDEYYELQEDWN